MDGAGALTPRACAVAAGLAAELPELRLWALDVEAATGRSTPEARERLRALSDRFRGATAVALRRESVPSAYRVLFRHLGLDPDVQRVPAEAAAVQRLLDGAFQPADRVRDALLVALAETGVPLWALDAATVTGELELRAGEGEGLVVADERAVVADLFGPVGPDVAVTKRTTAIRLYGVQAPGVPGIFVAEAFDIAIGLL